MKHTRTISTVLAAAMILSLAACQSGEEDSSQTDVPPAWRFRWRRYPARPSPQRTRCLAKVVADGQESILWLSMPSVPLSMWRPGDTVSAGEKICTLDMASTLSSYNAANISYSSAVQSYQDQKAVFDSQIALYEKNLSDLKALKEIGAASQLEIDQAELQLESAVATRNSTLSQLEAGMQSYKSNVEQLATVLENVDSGGNVISPVAGTVVTLNATEGGYVSASMPVAVVEGVDTMKVQVSVSEALVPKLGQGDEADVTISSLGVSTVGTIRGIEKAANAQTKLYTVTVALDEDIEGLLSGMFADVTFHTDTSADAVVVPTEAILTSGSTQYAFVVEDGVAKYTEVTIGLTGNGVTEVTSGLSEGQPARNCGPVLSG